MLFLKGLILVLAVALALLILVGTIYMFVRWLYDRIYYDIDNVERSKAELKDLINRMEKMNV
jgi:regulatory protein YycH of two-component signal transduction system YycFG